MPVVIHSNRIEGEIDVMVKSFINMSSCPKTILPIFLHMIDKMQQEIEILPIFPNIMYSTKLKTFLNVRRKRPVILIADEDTHNINIMIKNINRYTGYTVIDRIIFKKEKSINSSTGRKGAARYMCNPHHQVETIRALGCNNAITAQPEEFSMITIITTTDSICHGVAGLTVMCNKYNIPFMVEKRKVHMGKSWLLLKSDELGTKYELKDVKTEDFGTPSGKQNYSYYAGYTTYMPTERGFKEIVLRTTTNKGIMETIIQYIINILEMIMNYAKQLFKKKKMDKRSEKKKKSRKVNK